MTTFFEKIKQFFIGNFYYLIILSIPVFYAYYNIWNTFFIADAWNMLNSYTIARDFGTTYIFQLFAMPYGIHFLPIGVFLSSLEAYLFGVNATGYGILSLILHFINVFIVFYSVKKVTKNTFFALLAGIFFGVNYQIHEGVFWFASNTWTELSTSFVLLGLIYLLEFYKYRKLKLFLSSYFLFVSSLFLREYTFMLLVLNIIFFSYLFFKEKINAKKHILAMGLYLLTVVSYVLVRVIFVYAQNPVVLYSTGVSSKSFLVIIGTYLFTLPAKFLGNIIVPERTIIFLSHLISVNVYSKLAIAQTDVFQTVLFLDQLYILSGFIILFLIGILIARTKLRLLNDKIFFCLYGLAFLLVPLIFLTLDGYLYWLFSRYLYLPCALLTIFTFSLLSHLKLLRKKNVISISLFIIYVIYVAINMQMNHSYFVSSSSSGKSKENILKEMHKSLDFKKNQELIYVKATGNQYNNDTTILDFGSNSGKVLLTWSWFKNNQKNIPTCLLDPLFLFKDVNGYRYCNGKGYGYFQNIDILKKTLSDRHINASLVDAFEYDSKTDRIINISEEIRNKLSEKQ